MCAIGSLPPLPLVVDTLPWTGQSQPLYNALCVCVCTRPTLLNLTLRLVVKTDKRTATTHTVCTAGKHRHAAWVKEKKRRTEATSLPEAPCRSKRRQTATQDEAPLPQLPPPPNCAPATRQQHRTAPPTCPHSSPPIVAQKINFGRKLCCATYFSFIASSALTSHQR